jgi:pimeloyl-ACP methyl ester carboxylesterase
MLKGSDEPGEGDGVYGLEHQRASTPRTKSMMLRSSRNTVSIEVGRTRSGADMRLAIDIVIPDLLAMHPKLLLCLPGGGVNRHYFDMHDGQDNRFSFTQAMVGAGHVVAMVDPPGVGDSMTIEDPFDLTVTAQLPLLDHAIGIIRQELVGVLPAVGVGHSAGAMLTAALQAGHRCYDALALFCFGPAGLPQHLPQEWLSAVAADRTAAYEAIPDFAKAHFKRASFETRGRDSNGAAGRALLAVRSPTLAAIAMQAMTPGNVAAELAAIDVPVFTALGERDMLGPPHLLGQAFESCSDFTQIVVAGAGHNVFLSAKSQELFGRFAKWLDTLDAH